MGGRRRRRRWSRWPGGLVGMVALVAAVETYVGHRRDWVDPGAMGGSLALARLLPTVGNRRWLRDRLGLGGPPSPRAEAPVGEAARARWRPGGDPRLDAIVYPASWRCDGPSRPYVDRLLALAEA